MDAMADMEPLNQPTLARIAIGDMVRRAREARGIEPAELAAMIGYTRNSIVRIESGEQGTKTLVIEKICKVLGVPNAQMSLMTALVLRGKERGWWESFKAGAPPQFSLFAETEQTATLIQSWQSDHIPGLVQTSGYLQEIQRRRLPMSDEQKNAVRGYRLKRRELLASRSDDFTVRLLIGVSAIRHLDRMPSSIKREQVSRLRDADARPNFDLRIAEGPHAAMDGSFTILTPGPGPTGQVRHPFVYLEFLDGFRYIERADVVSTYEQAFHSACEIATPLKEYLS
jgi:transcriptional regulator with XRE-family HTH domain